MKFPMQPNRNAGLWWTAALALSIGLSIFILLRPDYYDPQVERYRLIALMASILIAGLCLIIGTSHRWFGKGL
jgi:hypothetical protein